MSRHSPPPSFEPIAIVGQACLLPGALSPAELFAQVVQGRDLITQAPPGSWRIDPAAVLATEPGTRPDRTFSDRGGYVRGFHFDPTGFAVPTDELADLDGLTRFVLHTARAALGDAGYAEGSGLRAGAVLGNLSYPTSELCRFAESIWGVAGAGPVPDARSRFMSGLPAHLLARALRLSAGAFALDAACASGLYAIKLACDRLHSRQADLMLAGAVNRADDLFLHVGFTALGALSRSGRSRPFHQDADGLLPAEGAAFVALRRLRDAHADGQRILGVIRACGLGNDGRAGGMLAPAESGQVRAMRRAYRQCGLRPQDISLVECHATGTAIGDTVEVRSMTAVWSEDGDRLARTAPVPIGSLKSNLGHLITAAGVAGLVKVLGAIAHRRRPPTLHCQPAVAALHNSPFRLLTAAEPWPTEGDQPRRAAVNAFGFGGNNAHLIVEEWTGETPPPSGSVAAPGARVAIVGIGVLAGAGRSTEDFRRDLFSGASQLRESAELGMPAARTDEVSLPLGGLRFPPQDLRRALGQQLLMLRAAELALSDGSRPPVEATGAIIGMQCDAEVARPSLRLRQRELLPGAGPAELDVICLPLEAASVLGSMPNIVANRLNSAWDLQGPSFTVSAEELSGLAALSLGMAALKQGELDACLVGAVDLCCEPVHVAAAQRVGITAAPGDAAVALLLKRLDDARRDGDRVYAVMDPDAAAAPSATFAPGGTEPGAAIDLGPQFGAAHAAVGLLHLAAAVLTCHHRALPQGRGREAAPLPPLPAARLCVAATALGGASQRVGLAAADEATAAPLLFSAPPRLRFFAGADRQAVLAALAERREGGSGPTRLCMVTDAAGEESAWQRARQILAAAPHGTPVADSGIYLYDRPVAGELASVFTFAAAAYAGMGRALLLALPELLTGACKRFPGLGAVAQRLYTEPEPAKRRDEPVELMQQLEAYSLLGQAHVELFGRLLGGCPQATIGLCTGESAALFATGAWGDMDAMFRAIRESGLYTRELGGELQAVRRAWAKGGADASDPSWATWRVRGPLPLVQAALVREPRCHLAIIHTFEDCLLVGQAAACQRVVTALGTAVNGRYLGPGMVIHCPELAEFAAGWRAIHHRATTAVPGIRYYSHARLGAYVPDAEKAADALLGQAQGTVDFPALIEQAYGDGVRIFVEHGPRGLCTGWIREILGSREHVAVSLDDAGRNPVVQVVHAVAQLVAAGVALDHPALMRRLGQAESERRAAAAGRELTFAAHFPPMVRKDASPASSEPAQVMAPAPSVPISGLWLEADPLAAPQPSIPSRPQHPVHAAHEAFLHHAQQAHTAFLAARTGVLHRLRGRSPAVPSRPLPVAAAALTGAGEPTVALSAAPCRSFSRAELELLAADSIAAVFGPGFAEQDRYRRQVRLPMPPLLLVDRVSRLDAPERTLGRGTIWTETDVASDAWFLHDGYVPAGVLVEAGQADLLLISWMGVDAENRGERVYRLLGCELIFHGSLPPAGSHLRYEIRVDGHAVQGDTRLFFFSHDCYVDGQLRMSMRNGQAGFFSDAELVQSGGVLWDAATAQPCPEPRLDAPVALPQRRSFDREAVLLFATGDLFGCFGRGFELGRTHVRPPRIPTGSLLFLHEVTELSPRGGPWGRGYLRAVQRVSPDDWFFACHFKDDPCMPGTLMCEACLQALAFFLAALGHTLHRDGWRFEPVSGETFQLRCRGQVIPTSREVVYEVFVEEIIGGPQPTIYADILATVDGLKAFHGRRMGYRLVPDWPVSSMPAALLGDPGADRPVASRDGFRFDRRSLLACAWGRPSQAFGEPFRRYDGPLRIPRLPGPPYHFMSRVAALDATCGELRVGSELVVEYDIPEAAWYFEQGAGGQMPFAILLEAALQPCGWLAMFIGCTLHTDEPLYFRNLDGTGTQRRPVAALDGMLSTRVRLTSLSRSGGVFLTGFLVECRVGSTPVYHMQTVFGFFPAAALRSQVGLPAAAPEGPSPGNALPQPIELHLRPARYFDRSPALPGPMLLMLDRVTAFEPGGGRAGLGRLTAEKDIEPGEWFFKAHFFQDPVQPGSLGVQALLHLLQFYMLHTGLGAGFAGARFESPGAGLEMSWKYRGQVLPTSRKVKVELDITRVETSEAGATATADGFLSVDGLRIYHVKGLSARISGSTAVPPVRTAALRPRTVATGEHWSARLGVPSWPGAEVWLALVERFVGRVVCADALRPLRGQPLLLLGNHQVQVESLLFPIALTGELDTPIVMLANALHRRGWVGQLSRLCQSDPAVASRIPDLIRFFDQTDRPSLLPIVKELEQQLTAGGCSVMVHVEGRLGHSCRDPVETVSSVFIDLALNADVPIVPVRFAGGLPVAPLPATRDFPVGYGRQDYFLGQPLWPQELRRLNYAERTRLVLAAINGECEDAGVGPGPQYDEPAAPDSAFAEAVHAWRLATGSSEPAAVVMESLRRLDGRLGPQLTRILRAATSGRLDIAPGEGETGHFLARLGRFLFGPRGPLVRLTSQPFSEERP